MKISEIKLHSIAIADPPLRSSYGLHAPWALRTIVELETDDGIRGVSETYGGEAPRAALEAIRERLLGMDPFRLAELSEEINTEANTEGGDDVAVPGGRSQTWLVPGENPLDQKCAYFRRHRDWVSRHHRKSSWPARLRSAGRKGPRRRAVLGLSFL